MVKANADIRGYAVQNNVPLWRVADQLGIHDSVLSRRLRKELPDDKKKEIFGVIDRLSKAGE